MLKNTRKQNTLYSYTKAKYNMEWVVRNSSRERFHDQSQSPINHFMNSSTFVPVRPARFNLQVYVKTINVLLFLFDIWQV